MPAAVSLIGRVLDEPALAGGVGGDVSTSAGSPLSGGLTDAGSGFLVWQLVAAPRAGARNWRASDKERYLSNTSVSFTSLRKSATKRLSALVFNCLPLASWYSSRRSLVRILLPHRDPGLGEQQMIRNQISFAVHS